MKKYISNIRTLAALLMAGATFAACSSDDSIIGEQPANQQVYTMTVNATKGDGATTRALSLDDSGAKNVLTATWATTENIYVKKGSDWAEGSLQPDADGAIATLKGNLSGITIAKDDVLTLQFPKNGDISYEGQLGTLENIAANFDYATASVTVESVSEDGNIIPTEATTTFQSQQAIVKFTLVDKADENSLNAMQLTVNDGTNTYTVNPTLATSEIYTAIPGFTGQTVTLTATVGDDTYTYEKTGVSFTNGKYYEIGVKMTKSASDVLSGVFSVSDSKKVCFSKGNLQATYDGSSWTWAFAENQWDYIGNAAGNTSINGNGTVSASNVTVDLFGWVGASSTWTGAAQYGISNSTATNSTNGYGNKDSEALKSDWGNTISDGYTWFTLTSAEWTYLFNTRTVNGGQGSGKSYTLGQSVNGKLGVVIYPDDYTGSVYAGSDWSTFEAAGCVFLPAAGYRYQASVSNAGSLGSYWSSSPNTSSRYSAYRVIFSSGSLNPASSDYRYDGGSVRLVRQVE